MELEILQILEIVQTIKEVSDVINDNTNDGYLLPDEAISTLEKLADNSEEPNTDLEVYLSEIKSVLMYDEESNISSLQEISARLEVIDTRLDLEFLALNECFGFISTVLIVILSTKFFSWLMNTFSP